MFLFLHSALFLSLDSRQHWFRWHHPDDSEVLPRRLGGWGPWYHCHHRLGHSRTRECLLLSSGKSLSHVTARLFTLKQIWTHHTSAGHTMEKVS